MSLLAHRLMPLFLARSAPSTEPHPLDDRLTASLLFKLSDHTTSGHTRSSPTGSPRTNLLELPLWRVVRQRFFVTNLLITSFVLKYLSHSKFILEIQKFLNFIEFHTL